MPTGDLFNFSLRGARPKLHRCNWDSFRHQKKEPALQRPHAPNCNMRETEKAEGQRPKKAHRERTESQRRRRAAGGEAEQAARERHKG